MSDFISYDDIFYDKIIIRYIHIKEIYRKKLVQLSKIDYVFRMESKTIDNFMTDN